MFVEDALQKLYVAVIQDDLFLSELPDKWAFNFTINVSRFVTRGNPLSTEQGRIILKLFDRVLPFLIANGRVSEGEARALLNEPVFAKEPFKSANIPREVRFLGDNLLGFRFKLNDIILADIKAIRKCFVDPKQVRFDRPSRIWIIPLTENSYLPVMQLIKKHRFQFDDAVAEFIAESKLMKSEPASVAMDDDFIAIRVFGNSLLSWHLKAILGGETV